MSVQSLPVSQQNLALVICTLALPLPYQLCPIHLTMPDFLICRMDYFLSSLLNELEHIQ